jgi:hypothetical protein
MSTQVLNEPKLTSSVIFPSVLDLDKIVVATSPEWSKIAKEYKSSGKIIIMINGTEIELSPLYVLKYLRSMSQLIVQSSLELYKKVHHLGDYDLLALAFGSENPTSDYDVAFVGKGSAELLKMIYESFKKSFPSKTLPLSYDTNGYLGPEFIVYSASVTPLHKLIGDDKIYRIQEYPGGNKRCIALPTSKSAIRVEAGSVLSKFNNAKTHLQNDKEEIKIDKVSEYDMKYDTIIKVGSRIESFLYGDEQTRSISGIKDEESYWMTIRELLQNSIEAYHTISTIIAVVIILQQKNPDIGTRLNTENWLIAALENIADLIEHGGIVYDETLEHKYKSSDDPIHIIHTSKYVLRCIECLKHTDKLKGMDISTMERIVNAVVSLRGGSVGASSGELIESYKKSVVEPIIQLVSIIEENVKEMISVTEVATSRKINRRNTRKSNQLLQKSKSRRTRIR